MRTFDSVASLSQNRPTGGSKPASPALPGRHQGSRRKRSIPFADPEFPRAFDNMSDVVTVGENESKQVSLTAIPVARTEEENRRLH
jgi:hypothetical protein